MEILYTLLRLTGSLILLLLFYAVTPWVSENTSNDFTPLLMPLTAFGAYVVTFI